MTAPAAARTFPRPQPRGLSSVHAVHSVHNTAEVRMVVRGGDGTRGHKEAACVLQLGPRPGDNSAQCAVPSWPGPGPGLLTTQCYR